MLTLLLFVKMPPFVPTCTALVPCLGPGTGRARCVCACQPAGQRGGECRGARTARVGSAGEASWDRHPGILLPLPLCCPNCTPRLPGPVAPTSVSTGAAPPRRVPSAPPTSVPRAGASTCSGRPADGTHATVSCPPPAWSVWVFSWLPLNFRTDPGTGDSDRQAAAPAGASSQPLPARCPGVLPRGLSRAHIFLILFPWEGLEPCTQPRVAARSVPTLGAEGLGDENRGGCKSHGAAEAQS